MASTANASEAAGKHEPRFVNVEVSKHYVRNLDVHERA